MDGRPLTGTADSIATCQDRRAPTTGVQAKGMGGRSRATGSTPSGARPCGMVWRAAIPDGAGIERMGEVRQAEEQQPEPEQHAPPQTPWGSRSWPAGEATSGAAVELDSAVAFDDAPTSTVAASLIKMGELVDTIAVA